MRLTRREMLIGAGSLGALGPLTQQSSQKPYRIAFVSDLHIQTEFRAFDLCLKALRKVKAENPQTIIFGGDHLMDIGGQTLDQAEKSWELLNRALKESDLNVPTYHLIGESDVWGLNKEKSGTTGTEPNWGKGRFLKNFQYDKTYQMVQLGGWTWFLLDNITLLNGDYIGAIDSEQLEWLTATLTSIPKDSPIGIATHIPLVAPSVLMGPARGSSLNLNEGKQNRNTTRLLELMAPHHAPKLCLAGHLHVIDRYDYNGVSYIGAGAVSGNWWQGRYREFEPAFTILDLWPDGTWKHETKLWGWSSE